MQAPPARPPVASSSAAALVLWRSSLALGRRSTACGPRRLRPGSVSAGRRRRPEEGAPGARDRLRVPPWREDSEAISEGNGRAGRLRGPALLPFADRLC